MLHRKGLAAAMTTPTPDPESGDSVGSAQPEQIELAIFANSVRELLVVNIHQLNMIVCVAYRTPDTRINEFNGLLKCLDENLSSIPSPGNVMRKALLCQLLADIGKKNLPEANRTGSRHSISTGYNQSTVSPLGTIRAPWHRGCLAPSPSPSVQTCRGP